MIDDPNGIVAWFDPDSPEPAELSDRDRRGVIGIGIFLTFVFLSFSVYAGLDTGELGTGLAFAGLSLFAGGSVIVINLDVLTIWDRVRLSLTLNLAVRIGGRARRWQAEDWQVAVETSPHPFRYGLGLVLAAVHMRLYDLGTLLLRAACWMLASNHRTWWPLGAVLAFAAINIHLSQGWGSAFYTLPTIAAFHLGIEHLRRRWNIPRKRD
ncbi:hypothetical protein [Streptosporangium saharense]|uniref:hypothetical protein n=1 Tax=Streptosporangium saharense TaxID=1706840 RepID=UPI003699D819